MPFDFSKKNWVLGFMHFNYSKINPKEFFFAKNIIFASGFLCNNIILFI